MINSISVYRTYIIHISSISYQYHFSPCPNVENYVAEELANLSKTSSRLNITNK